MRLAVMQPYWFAYAGYFQLIQSVDAFVFLDDVNFITRGWVNRNRWLVAGQPQYFTVPVDAASQNARICDLQVSSDARWRRKMAQTLFQSYGKARFFDAVNALFEATLRQGGRDIGTLAKASVRAVIDYLGLDVRLVDSSSVYGNAALKGQDRIIDICVREGATDYHNLPGGRALYQPQAFARRGIALHFLDPRLPAYPQAGKVFVPGLSILDVLMHNDPETARMMLQ